MRLLAVEVRRFWSRRGIAVVLLLVVAAAVLLAGSAIWSTRGATESEVAAAQRQLDGERAVLEDDYQRCLQAPPPAGDDASAPSPEERCQELDPQLDWFLPRPELDLTAQMEGYGLALALILAGAALVVATTFAGADWRTRAVSTQLVFRPRRLSLWLSKAAAVVLGVTIVAAVVTALFWTSLGFVASTRDLDVGGELVGEVALYGARSVALAAACALGAYALTMALRSTLVTLALVFAAAVASEALWAALPLEKSSQWSLAVNVQAWILNGFEVYDESSCDPGPSCDPTYMLSASHGALYLGALLLLAVVVSVVSFSRRDVP